MSAHRLTVDDYLQFVESELDGVLGLRENRPARVYLRKARELLSASSSAFDWLKSVQAEIKRIREMPDLTWPQRYGLIDKAILDALETVNNEGEKELDIDMENERRREYNEKHFDDEVKG